MNRVTIVKIFISIKGVILKQLYNILAAVELPKHTHVTEKAAILIKSVKYNKW